MLKFPTTTALTKFYSIFLVVLLSYVVQSEGLEKFGNCKTPKNEDGACVRLGDCNYAVDILLTRMDNSNTDYLKKSQCGYDKTQSTADRQILICCALENCKQDVAVQPGNVLPGTDQCGQFLENRIYGGNLTSMEEFPWAALILHKIHATKVVSFHCGGALINSRYILTAAHCIDTDDSQWSINGVRLGDWDTTTDPDCDPNKVGKECAPPYQDFEVEAAIMHPEYVPKSLDQYHDIALLRLKTPVTYSKFVKPVCLNVDTSQVSNRLADETDMEVVGWGLTENLTSSDIKLKANLKVSNEEKCRSTYRYFNRTVNGTYQICAGGKQNVDTCKGDSGGPLMLKKRVNNKDVYYIEGIVSYGATPCGVANWPGVYTRVGNYIDWIKETLKP